MPEQRGNCYPTTLACLLNVRPENVPNFETLFDLKNKPHDFWKEVMMAWVENLGCTINSPIELYHFHRDCKNGVPFETLVEQFPFYIGRLYMVIGESERGSQHICIYKDGKLYWDVHPSRSGLLTEAEFQIINPL